MGQISEITTQLSERSATEKEATKFWERYFKTAQLIYDTVTTQFQMTFGGNDSPPFSTDLFDLEIGLDRRTVSGKYNRDSGKIILVINRISKWPYQRSAPIIQQPYVQEHSSVFRFRFFYSELRQNDGW